MMARSIERGKVSTWRYHWFNGLSARPSKYAETLPPLACTWKMVFSDEVTHRLAVLVEAASAESGSDGFTFRQLWQFCAHSSRNRRSRE